MAHLATQTTSILLYGRDARLVETRAWVLEKAGFRIFTAGSLFDLQKIGMEEPIELFLLCDSLDREARSQALVLIHLSWPRAKRLVLTPTSFTAEIEPTEVVFHAMDGPAKLVTGIRTLVVNGSASA